MRCIVCDLVTENIDHKFFVNLEFWFVVGDEIGHFICEDYNISDDIEKSTNSRLVYNGLS